jgi:hypothetical protein
MYAVWIGETMKEYIKIIFHKLNTEITAELLADFNPYLCEAFKKNPAE